MKSKKNQIAVAGFTLLEVTIAVAILSIGVMAAYMMQLTSITGNSSANRLSDATNTASVMIEEIVNMPYNAASYDLDIDINGDGTIDTDLATFTDGPGSTMGDPGLNDESGGGGTADFTCTITGGGRNLTVDINVSRNSPAADMDTLRVIVRNNIGFGSRVSFTTIKSSI